MGENSFDSDMATRRGFTDHEHLDEVELIHMNGRVFDYQLGRFLSVDPYIQEPGNSQSINPYSYIMNNPMAGTDPTGYRAEEGQCQHSGYFCSVIVFSGQTRGEGSKQSASVQESNGTVNQAESPLASAGVGGSESMKTEEIGSQFNQVGTWGTENGMETVGVVAQQGSRNYSGLHKSVLFGMGLVEGTFNGIVGSNGLATSESMMGLGFMMMGGRSMAEQIYDGAVDIYNEVTGNYAAGEFQQAGVAASGVVGMALTRRPIGKGPLAGGGAKLENLSPADAKRIQNAANRTKQDISVVGSRASGKSNPNSDWDYIFSGNNRQRHSARSSVPRGTQGGEVNSMGRETGIDVWQSYNPKAPNYSTVNTDQPHIIFRPQ
nr:RHS repeat-associated core domain-containing protein [Marinibactrum halimedae]